MLTHLGQDNLLHPTLSPYDEINQQLERDVHPTDWVNPDPSGTYNLVVIGAGTAGLVTAIGGAGLGAKVALIERHLMGGDCLNVGCVPSKALIRPARLLAEIKAAKQFGIQLPGSPEVDFAAIMQRMRRVRTEISPNDSAKRYKEAGVDVFFGSARFVDSNHIEVEDKKLRFKTAVIASGARAAAPPIDGLEKAGYLTNETIFSLEEQPTHLAIIGAGPIGCELAQAFCRLGTRVTILEYGSQFLPREDPDAAQLLFQSLVKDGVEVLFNAKTQRVRTVDGGREILVDIDGEERSIVADQLLVAVGRAPNVEELNLDLVGVEFDWRAGVRVSDKLQTTNPHIYAAGDVCSKYKFTHTADAAARIVLSNALFKGRQKVSDLVIPWCTYTDPEIAHVGLYAHDAKEMGLEVDSFTTSFEHVDRAITEGNTEGFVRIHVKRGSDSIVGCTIVGEGAGDLISEVTVAMVNGVGLKGIAKTIHPYPTRAEAIKRTADAYNRTRLTPFVKKVFRGWLSYLRR